MNILKEIGLMRIMFMVLTFIWVVYNTSDLAEDNRSIIKRSVESYQSNSGQLHDKYMSMSLSEKINYSDFLSDNYLFNSINIDHIRMCYREGNQCNHTDIAKSISDKNWSNPLKESLIGCIVIEENFQVCNNP